MGVPRRGGLRGRRGRSEELLRHDFEVIGELERNGNENKSPWTREVDMGLRLTFLFSFLICIDHVGAWLGARNHSGIQAGFSAEYTRYLDTYLHMLITFNYMMFNYMMLNYMMLNYWISRWGR